MSQKTMTEIKCTKCGNSATVPFKPTAGKPVYCRSCFSKVRSTQGTEPSSPRQFDMKNVWAILRDDWHGRREKSYDTL
ncbi:MAG: hypothetical protein JSV58_01725 [Candidatus Bathyarchaeota archaeon]|nr:MAG: hypothetical protein JSV58_01725 [Candidatus Bathyarchaeota archaeon]